MAIVKETKHLLYYSDLLIANFWRYLLQYLWLFFPPILFLLLAYFSFWHLPQGKDLIVISLQNAKFSPAIFPCFINLKRNTDVHRAYLSMDSLFSTHH